MRTRNGLMGMMLVGLCTVTACGDDGGEKKGDAQVKCESFIQRICTVGADCAVEAGLIQSSGRAKEFDDCKTSITAELDCSKAVKVSATYDTCMEQVSNADCNEVAAQLASGQIELPTSCHDLIFVTE
jgi:hypothetical protein